MHNIPVISISTIDFFSWLSANKIENYENNTSAADRIISIKIWDDSDNQGSLREMTIMWDF